MRRQKSFINDFNTLYLVATPIGNLDDMTFRSIETLKKVDVIFAEDKRVSIKLLNHFDIKTPLHTYHEFNKESATKEIIDKLMSGLNIALISDAGYPVISDPGYFVVKEALKEDINVVSIPGANALLSALVVSGIAPMPFTFFGFLDSKEGKRRKQLEEFKKQNETIILYESPHRINKTLNNIYEVLGDREIALARELTKKFEEIITGKVSEIKDIEDIKGEMVIIIGPNNNEEVDLELSLIDAIEREIDNGLSEKEAIKIIAKKRKLQKNTVYMEYHSNKK